MAKESFFYGQGKVKLATLNSDGSLGEWRWIGDVSELKGSLDEKKVEHIESFSGKRTKIRDFAISASMTLNATIHDLNTDNLAIFTQGKIKKTAGGSVTGESLGTVTAGKTVSLAHIGVSDVVIKDSTAVTPKVIAEDHYVVDDFGNIEFLSLPTPAPTLPLKADYDYAGTEQVALFSATARPNVALRYEGINLAEGNTPVLMELYKLTPGLLNELSMITSGDSVAAVEVSFGALVDTSKPAAGDLGQFGRIVSVVA